MKYLSDYTEDLLSEAFKKNGAFFAFSDDQLNEKKVDGVEYASMGMGLICPKDNCKQMRADILEIGKLGREMDVAENGRDKIIERELYNHEAFYTMDIEDTFNVLECYGITENEIRVVYNNLLARDDHDNF